MTFFDKISLLNLDMTIEEEPVLSMPKEEENLFSRFMDEDLEEAQALPSPFQIMQPLTQTFQPQVSPEYVEVAQIFEHLVDTMTLLVDEEGDRTTVIQIDMAGSAFEGTEITIKEFSTAPLVFNIELRGHPQAVDLFKSHLDGLMKEFNAKKSLFTVHACQVHYHHTPKKPPVTSKKIIRRETVFEEELAHHDSRAHLLD